MTRIGTLGGEDSTAADVNDRGVVVGSARDGTQTWKAFILDEGGLRALSNLPSGGSNVKASGFSRLFVLDMNDRGDIVGWGWKAGDSNEHGFLLRTR